MNTFKVGDKVKIVRKVEEQEGWENDWADEMNEYVGNGEAYEILEVYKYGLQLAGAWFHWPSDALELVEAAPDVFKIDDPVMVRDYDDQEWNKRHFAGYNKSGSCLAWDFGFTSWTSQGCCCVPWAQCRRPAPEELGN